MKKHTENVMKFFFEFKNNKLLEDDVLAEKIEGYVRGNLSNKSGRNYGTRIVGIYKRYDDDKYLTVAPAVAIQIEKYLKKIS